MHLAFDKFGQQSRYIDVFNRGVSAFHFDAKPSAPWILLSSTSGEVAKEDRLEVSIDWANLPPGKADGDIRITQAQGPPQAVRVSAFLPQSPVFDSADGFVEGDGYVSMEAEHFTRATSADQVQWQRIPDYGETLSGMSVFPVDAGSVLPPKLGPTLEYRMYLFDGGSVNVEAILGPSLNFVPGRGLRFAIAFDDQPPQVIDALEHNSDRDWAKSVSDGVRRVEVMLDAGQPGCHILRFGMVDPGIVLEKLIVSSGPLKPGYLGPPESYRYAAPAAK
jgi:hypothetical protein